MATFYNFTIAQDIDTALAVLDKARLDFDSYAERITKAKDSVETAFAEYAATSRNIDQLNAKIEKAQAALATYNGLVSKKTQAEKKLREWQDIKCLFECGGNEQLRSLVEQKPVDPATIKIPAEKPEPVGRELVLAYIAESKRRIEQAEKVTAALAALDALKVEQQQSEENLKALQTTFKKKVAAFKSDIFDYEREEADERHEIENQLAEIEAAEAENAKKREDLKTRLGFFGKVAAKFKG